MKFLKGYLTFIAILLLVVLTPVILVAGALGIVLNLDVVIGLIIAAFIIGIIVKQFKKK